MARTESNVNLTGRVSKRPRSGRVNRYPSHRFAIKSRPFELQAIMFAPVLPGETMRNLLVQSRVVSDPLSDPLAGAHQEYHFFYVKLTDLDPSRVDLSKLLELDQAVSASDLGSLVTDRVVECYFREQTADRLAQVESVGSYLSPDFAPVAQYRSDSVRQSLKTQADWQAAETAALANVVGDINADENNDGTITINEIERQKEMLRLLEHLNASTRTYEEWLRQYGVSVAPMQKENPRRPERIRSISEWTYPSNTIQPSTGKPSSAWSWAIADRADKDRYFAEPGFIVGMSVCRPKVFHPSSAALELKSGMDWLPALLNSHPNASLKSFTAGAGPWSSLTSDYIYDQRDLFLYGEDRVSSGLPAYTVTPHVIDGHVVTRYPMVDKDFTQYFVDVANAVADPAKAQFIKQDGVVSLTIAGSQRDMSSSSAASAKPAITIAP